MLLVTIIDFLLKFLFSFYLLLIVLRLTWYKVAFHRFFRVILDLLNLLSEILTEQGNFLPELLYNTLLDLDFGLTELFNFFELEIGLLFNFIYLVI